MKKAVAIVLFVFLLGFSGSAFALALYDLSGTTGAESYFDGILGIEGISGFSDLKEGQTYNWFYNLAYREFVGPGASIEVFLGTRTHWGTVDATIVQDLPSGNVWYELVGDDGAALSNIDQTIWMDPLLGFTHASLHQLTPPSQSVPEPSATLLLASGLVGLGLLSKRMVIGAARRS